MSVKLIKAIKTVLVNSLTVIINQRLKTGIFPDKFKIARIKPLHKKDDETFFSNYSPISLLPVISKISEKVVFMQLYTYFKGNKLLYNHQYMVLHNSNTTELAALELVDRVIQDMDKGETPFNI